jgi:TonB family protein
VSLPPPVRGAEKPTVARQTQQVTPEKARKVQEPPKDARVAELNPKKKPKRPEPKPAVEPAKEDSRTQEDEETRSRGLPEGVELGSEFASARLDAAGFESPYYLNILFSKIRNQWDNPFEGPDTIICTIYFVISRDGKVIDHTIENSSGIPAYDQSALRAVLASRPPPLPNQYDSPELGIHLEFQYIPY